jgi:hypothetical protein
MHEAATQGLGEELPQARLVSKNRWARFELVLGRIRAVSLLGGQRQCVQNHGPADEISETLAINTDAEIPVIRYELLDGVQSLRIEVIDQTEIEIVREARDGLSVPTVRYSQPTHGPVQLSLEQGEVSRTIEASSLWHVFLAEPELCREHLLPILQPLNPGWRLEEAIERTEARLCSTSDGETVPRKRVVQLIARIDAADFRTRRNADRELRALGVTILPYLHSLDSSRLTREQRLRVKRLRQEISDCVPDTPFRIASWLRHDECLWRAWEEHRDPQRRFLAQNQLAAIHADPAFERGSPGAKRRMAQMQADR